MEQSCPHLINNIDTSFYHSSSRANPAILSIPWTNLFDLIWSVSPESLLHLAEAQQRNHRTQAEDQHHWHPFPTTETDYRRDKSVWEHRQATDQAYPQRGHLHRVNLRHIHKEYFYFEGYCEPEHYENHQLENQASVPAVFCAYLLSVQENQDKRAKQGYQKANGEEELPLHLRNHTHTQEVCEQFGQVEDHSVEVKVEPELINDCQGREVEDAAAQAKDNQQDRGLSQRGKLQQIGIAQGPLPRLLYLQLQFLLEARKMVLAEAVAPLKMFLSVVQLGNQAQASAYLRNGMQPDEEQRRFLQEQTGKYKGDYKRDDEENQEDGPPVANQVESD